MIYQQLSVQTASHEGRLTDGFTPTLTTYIPDNSPEIEPTRLRKAVLLCPGGGYMMTSDREAEPVALALAGAGYAAFVLRYSVAPATFPTALVEVATAVSMIRAHAAEWFIDPDHIVVGGFSAGGHLAASLGTYWQTDYLAEQSGLSAEQIKPNGLLLSYPVLTSGDKAHRGSFEYLLDDRYDAQMLAKTSLETQVTACMPSTFMWHTYDDNVVPVENSLLMATAIKQQNVPLELHIFPAGAHGLSLCDNRSAGPQADHYRNPCCAAWFDLFLTWLGNL